MTGSRVCVRAGADRSTGEEALEFGRCRVLLRRRQLLADGVPIGLGTRAFELLLALLEADGRLVGKEELLARVWPGITVEEGNLKAQVRVLRRALGKDGDFIRTEHGRGYRFTAAIRGNSRLGGAGRPMAPRSWPARGLFAQRSARPAPRGWSYADRFSGHFDPDRDGGTASGGE